MESLEETVDKKFEFRMSGAGRCARALTAEMLNMEVEPAPAWLEQAAEEGSWHEDRIATREKAERRQLEIKLEYPSFDLVGHIDGMVCEDGNYKLLEIKSMSHFEFQRWMRDGFNGFPNYAAQITCYMEATKLDKCLYIVKNRSSGYEDRQILTTQPYPMTQIIANLTEAHNYYLSGQLPPKEFDAYSIECRRCNYKHLCLAQPEELTPVQQMQLDSACEDWRKGKALVDEGQTLIDTAKGIFNQHLQATNQPRMRIGDLALQIVKYGDSVTYPKAKLLSVFTEEQLLPAAETKKGFEQLRITDLGGE